MGTQLLEPTIELGEEAQPFPDGWAFGPSRGRRRRGLRAERAGRGDRAAGAVADPEPSERERLRTNAREEKDEARTERHRTRAQRAEARRSSALRKWAGRLWSAVLGLFLLVVLALTVGPALLPYRTHVVLGGSMEPTIPIRSVVVMLPVAAEDLEVGDIISFHAPGDDQQLVTHRIVRMDTEDGAPVFVTRGDANGVSDSWRIPAQGTGWRLAFHVPYLGYLQASLLTPQMRSLLFVGAGVLIGIWAMVRIWRPTSGEEQVAEGT